MKLFKNIFRRKNRDSPSVTDFNSKEELKLALGVDVPSLNESSASFNTSATNESTKSNDDASFGTSCLNSGNIQVVDWKIPIFDEETTKIQTMEKELERLLILRSFNILDSGHSEHFDRIVQLAAEIFHAPIALISLVDLGRQWFLSTQGLDETVTETSRDVSICAHVVEGKSNQPLVIKDLTKDFRFKENPLVTGPLALRFYAGAPLISPEGEKLGSFCVIDTVPRLDEFTVFEEEILTDLANMTMKIMVERRAKLASLQERNADTVETVTLLESFDRMICPVTETHKLYQNINTFIGPLPKAVPITIDFDPNIDTHVECDDLLLFRSSLILLNHAVTRTSSGAISFHVSMREKELLFECLDTGSPMASIKEKSPLSALQAMVRKMGGKFGFTFDGKIKCKVWFSVPYIAIPMYDAASDTKSLLSTAPLTMHHVANLSIGNSTSSDFQSKQMKDAEIVNDPFYNSMGMIGCKPLASNIPKPIKAKQNDIKDMKQMFDRKVNLNEQ